MRYLKIVLILVPFFAILNSCEKTVAPQIQGITEIVVSDNGNAGDASDIEVNFKEQSEQSNILEYRVFLVKSENVNSFTVEEALELSANQYQASSPEDIFPVRGISFNSSNVDSDGDPIREGVQYRIVVMTVVVDENLESNALSIHTEDFSLTLNNLVSNLVQPLDEVSAGSLSITNDDKIVMGGYDIVDHVSESANRYLPVFQFNRFGSTEFLTDPVSMLTGSAVDSENNIFISDYFNGSIIKIENQSIVSTITINDRTINTPDGIFINQNNEIFLALEKANQILKVDELGNSELYARVPNRPRGITGDENGNLYISHNNEEGTITKIDADRTVSTLANLPTYIPSDYALPYVMWLGYITLHEDHLYVAGMSTDKIYKLSLDGSYSTFAGSGKRGIPRGDARTANFNRPLGLAFSKDGKFLYVSSSADTSPLHTQSTSPAQILKIEINE